MIETFALRSGAGEIERGSQMEAKLRAEIKEMKDVQLESEKQHRKLTKQVEDQKSLEVSAVNQKLDDSHMREEGLKQTIADLRTREATIEAQIAQLKSKVDDCGRLIEEQAAELKERAEAQNRAKQELKTMSEELDTREQMVRPHM